MLRFSVALKGTLNSHAAYDKSVEESVLSNCAKAIGVYVEKILNGPEDRQDAGHWLSGALAKELDGTDLLGEQESDRAHKVRFHSEAKFLICQ